MAALTQRLLRSSSVEDRGFETPCWIWGLYCDPQGYARMKVNGRPGLAHRYAYEDVVGPVPAGCELDHLCRQPSCVNPDHLEAVTHAENVRRGWPAQKAHCAHGHPYDEANTYFRPNGRRDCRACTAERQRRYQQRRREVAA